jgi:two-component system, LytTR family, response regulator
MKVIVVDDERLARKELISMLAQHPALEVVAECGNTTEATEAIEKYNPDLVFLDVQMPGKSGFDLVNELDSMPPVIFVTAFDEFAIKAFEVNALDYLLKPVSAERLESALKKIATQTSHSEEAEVAPTHLLGEQDRIFIKDGEKCWFVPLSDIRMFESEGNYVRVFFNDFKPLILKSLNSLEERLDSKVFFRANRKFIVNLKYVNHIENWFNGGLQVHLKSGDKVEISRRQAVRFKEMMSL